MAEAATHFNRGVTLYGETDYPAALVEFSRAYALAPTWRVLFNIGQAHFQLHEYVDAMTTLQRFLDEGGDQVKAKQRELVQSELASLADRIGRVTVESNVTGATVSVDDQVVGVTPLTSPVLMSAGIRRVSATREGRPPVEERVSVAGGDSIVVRLDFAAPTPAPSPAASAGAPAGGTSPGDWPAPDQAARPPNRLPAAIAFGFAVAGAGVGATFGAIALGDRSHLDRVCNNKACPSSAQSDISALSRDALVANIGFGVAIAAAAAGVTLWLVAPSLSGHATSHTSLRVGPGTISGTF
jgi:hypothetical protein